MKAVRSKGTVIKMKEEMIKETEALEESAGKKGAGELLEKGKKGAISEEELEQVENVSVPPEVSKDRRQ